MDKILLRKDIKLKLGRNHPDPDVKHGHKHKNEYSSAIENAAEFFEFFLETNFSIVVSILWKAKL